jgi:hypothetical protein
MAIRNNNQGKTWCFTWFPPNDAVPDDFNLTIRQVNQLFLESDRRARVRGLVYQWERSPDTQRLHLQGALWLTKNARFSGLKDLLGAVLQNIHLEKARGSWASNVAYCSKEDSRLPDTLPYQEGDLASQQGKRSDLDRVYEALKGGASNFDIVDNFFGSWVKYHNGIRSASLILRGQEPRTEPPLVLVLVGPTGTGKSRWARSVLPDAHWQDPGVSKWWDGLDYNEPVIIDDYDGAFGWTDILTLFDRYPKKVQVKGGFVQFRPPVVIVTSNTHPRDWYTKRDVQRRGARQRTYDIRDVPRYPWDATSPLRRRVTAVIDTTRGGGDISSDIGLTTDPDGDIKLLIKESNRLDIERIQLDRITVEPVEIELPRTPPPRERAASPQIGVPPNAPLRRRRRRRPLRVEIPEGPSDPIEPFGPQPVEWIDLTIEDSSSGSDDESIILVSE